MLAQRRHGVHAGRAMLPGAGRYQRWDVASGCVNFGPATARLELRIGKFCLCHLNFFLIGTLIKRPLH